MGRFRKQKIGRMLNEQHVLHLFVRMRDGRIGMASTRPEFISELAAFQRFQRTHDVSPTLKILESVMKTNEKR